MSLKDNCNLPKRANLGGCGGGSIVQRTRSEQVVVPFLLPKGDRSMVQSDASGEANAPKKHRYAIAKPLERKASGKRLWEEHPATGELSPWITSTPTDIRRTTAWTSLE